MLEFGSNLIRPLSWMYVLYVETNIFLVIKIIKIS